MSAFTNISRSLNSMWPSVVTSSDSGAASKPFELEGFVKLKRIEYLTDVSLLENHKCKNCVDNMVGSLKSFS